MVLIMGFVVWMFDGIFIGVMCGWDMCNMMVVFFVIYIVVVLVLVFVFGNDGFWVVLIIFFIVWGIILGLKYSGFERFVV